MGTPWGGDGDGTKTGTAALSTRSHKRPRAGSHITSRDSGPESRQPPGIGQNGRQERSHPESTIARWAPEVSLPRRELDEGDH